MKPIRIESRIKNNILYRAIFDSYDSITSFCRRHELQKTQVGSLLNLKMSPYKRKGKRQRKENPVVEYKSLAINLSAIFGIEVEDLFPDALYTGVSKTKVVRELSFEALPDGIESPMLSLEEGVSAQELERDIEKVFKTLTPRQAEVLRRRMADETLEEIGTVLGVTRESIRRIEAQALRSLRHPLRRGVLEKHL